MRERISVHGTSVAGEGGGEVGKPVALNERTFGYELFAVLMMMMVVVVVVVAIIGRLVAI